MTETNAATKMSGDGSFKGWAFRRDGYNPDGGFVIAKTASEAFSLVQYMHGPASGVTVFCAETNQEFVDGPKGIRRVSKKV